jgi:hypothetical protein
MARGRRGSVAPTLALALTCAAVFAITPAARAQSSAELCGPFMSESPRLAPILGARLVGAANDHAFGCMAWQSFVALNWPARVPGEPDPAARFGGPGVTVWETFKRYDEVFLPHGAAPAPWPQGLAAPPPPRRLGMIHQTDGGILVDRAGKPVYYEMLINRDEFAYIVANKLYDATAQLAFARADGIVLPAGAVTEYGNVGTVEIKAAWKLLSAAELAERPRRFHTAEAILEDGTTAMVGLVGFHLNQRIEGFTQGLWASFIQIDSAPVAGADAAGRAYSFYDPACAACAANMPTEPPHSTQVEQVFPVAPSARSINAYMQTLIRDADAGSPWQFYELLGVQWPQFALGFPTPVPEPQRGARQSVPLAIGTPSTQTLMSPVLETFRQSPNVSCLGCHAEAATALAADSGPFAADYSFLFRHAETPAKP